MPQVGRIISCVPNEYVPFLEKLFAMTPSQVGDLLLAEAPGFIEVQGSTFDDDSNLGFYSGETQGKIAYQLGYRDCQQFYDDAAMLFGAYASEDEPLRHSWWLFDKMHDNAVWSDLIGKTLVSCNTWDEAVKNLYVLWF